MHKSSHIYSNRFKNKKNTGIYCKNVLNTIKATLKIKDKIENRFGKSLLNVKFKKGRCRFFVSKKEIRNIEQRNF